MARRFHDLFMGHRTEVLDGTMIETSPFLDETMPGAGGWRDLHRPYLEKARALIVICTPDT